MRAWRLWLGLALALLFSGVHAEPYLAIRTGLKCVACHVNPTGGGLRNAVGNAFAQGAIPANALPEALQGWNGSLLDDRLRLGGDLRTATTRTAVAGQPTSSVGGTEQVRLYADVQLVKDYLGAYLDQQVAPGKSERQEAYVRLSTPGLGWYAKAGQFYLPFGWRLQDSQAFVRQLSGINMTEPDKGLELGHESDEWSVQLVRSGGPGNKGGVSGHQTTAQAIWIQPWGRVGAAAAQVKSSAGDRQAWGLFAGTATGPVAWLAELDLVSDAGYPEGTRRQLATLLEANWLVRQGHNLKLTSEYLDPDRRVAHDNKVRYSLVYEYTPIAFVQLRAGMRKFGGIPQNATDNRRQAFAELHGMF
ncbi:hypothetical protein ACG04R_27610 [Roseateles sp. BYS78W]|uniref:Cytochrome c domain-containing protein n=1 Tax=Pelomonas candidula TaxID=3299025 RepID=A0ABW7HKL1_9BURK